MRVVVAQVSAEGTEDIRRMLLGMGLECGGGDCVPHGELLVRLAQNPADLVILVAGPDEAATLNLLRQATPLTKAPIIVMGQATDAQQVLRYLHGGAREFLDQDQLPASLENILDRLRLRGEVKYGTGQVVGVTSATPGSGVTTVAINLAFVWAEQHPQHIALMELGRGPADIALALDLQPRHTTADVHQNWERLDATFLRQSMLAHPAGLQILAHKPEALTVEPIPAQAVRKSVILLRTIYTGAVLDLGQTLGEEQAEAMRLCDTLAVVVRLDVPALRQARRYLRLLGDRGIPRDRIRLVANRYGQRGEVSWKKAEEAVGGAFAGYISEDAGKVNSAVNQGQPLVKVSRYAGITRRFFKLLEQLNGRPA